MWFIRLTGQEDEPIYPIILIIMISGRISEPGEHGRSSYSAVMPVF